MENTKKTAIVTGASHGIGAGAAQAFLKRGYRVVATSRNITKTNPFAPSADLALVDGDIGDPGTAATIVDTALSRFGRIDALVNNAGIYISKPFTDYTLDDLHSLISVNIDGFVFVTQQVIKRMLAQQAGGSIVNITAAQVGHPIAGVNSALSMITKGGIQAGTLSLAMEYAKQGIRVNAVAPGVVDTNLQKDAPNDFLKTRQPMGGISEVKDIVDAILYLTEAGQVTGEILHVDGGAHVGRW
jgi:NAD(P)-dependent dehydrogenase (short-subunit alcohol dehydrogenase family)